MGYSDDLHTRVQHKLDRLIPTYTHALTIKTQLLATGTGGSTAREKYTFPTPFTDIVAVRVEAMQAANNADGTPASVYACAGGVLDAVDVDIDEVSAAGVVKLADIPQVPVGTGAATGSGANPAPEIVVFPSSFTVGTGAVDVFLVAENSSDTTANINAKITIYMNDPTYTYPAHNQVSFAELADLP